MYLRTLSCHLYTWKCSETALIEIVFLEMSEPSGNPASIKLFIRTFEYRKLTDCLPFIADPKDNLRTFLYFLCQCHSCTKMNAFGTIIKDIKV